jgi:hypothetical protein
LNRIGRVFSLGGALADSNFWSIYGAEIRLPDEFYNITSVEREYVFLHEMGHNYFEFVDENEGNRSIVKKGPCKKEDVSHLLKVQWMELGLWELDLEKWEKIKTLNPENKANQDKYTYMVMYKNPNYKMGEWKCSLEARILQNSFHYGFKYDKPFYSPKEEMADAYALFILEKYHFLECAEENEVIKAKYEFIQNHFKDDSKGKFAFIRPFNSFF